MDYKDIPQFPRADYQIDVDWEYLEETLEEWNESYGIELNPDFQRAHVWTEQQRTEFWF